MTEQGTSFAFGGCRDSKNVVSEDLDWSVQLVISYKLSPFRAELLTLGIFPGISENYHRVSKTLILSKVLPS